VTGWIYQSCVSGGLFKVVEIETRELVLVRKAALRKRHLWEPVGVARSLLT
jgi:hypothetical protein